MARARDSKGQWKRPRACFTTGGIRVLGSPHRHASRALVVHTRAAIPRAADGARACAREPLRVLVAEIGRNRGHRPLCHFLRPDVMHLTRVRRGWRVAGGGWGVAVGDSGLQAGCIGMQFAGCRLRLRVVVVEIEHERGHHHLSGRHIPLLAGISPREAAHALGQTSASTTRCLPWWCCGDGVVMAW